MLIKNKKKNREKGFTLIEMLVAMTLFSFVVTVALGALFMILKANEKTKVIKLVVNNLNMALEGMSREIRVGYNYDKDRNNCDSGTGCDNFTFKTKDKCDALFRLKTTDGKGRIYKKIKKKKSGDTGTNCTGGDNTEIPITSSDVDIKQLVFRTFGVGSGNGQPRVLMTIQGKIHRPNLDEEFNIQTTVSQRKIDTD